MSILRREFLFGLFCLPFVKKETQYKPISKLSENLGKFISMSINYYTGVENFFLFSSKSCLPNFPVETTIDIKFEKGTECWKALNVNIKDLVKLNKENFYKECKIIPTDFLTTLEWRGYKFTLSHIFFEDKAEDKT